MTASDRSTAYEPCRFSNADDEVARLQKQARFLVEEEITALRALDLPVGGTVIDAGCGPGAAFPHLRTVLAPRKIIGIDRDRGVLNRSREANPPTSVAGLRADIASLPIASASVDVVHFRLVLKWQQEPQVPLRSAYRVLRRGGAAVIVDTDDAGLILEPQPDGFGELLDVFHAESSRLGADHFLGRRLYSMLTAVGFAEVTVGVRAFTTVGVGARDFAEILLQPIVSAATRGVTEDRREQARAALLRWGEDRRVFGCVLGFFACGFKP